MTCVIFCGGEITDYGHVRMCRRSGNDSGRRIEDADFVISADSGARHCRALGVVPDIMVGDFDSISQEDYEALIDAGSEALRYPAEKDMTDSELAVDIAISKGFSSVIFFGATGTRLDHSISNIFLLKKLADANIEGIIMNENNCVRLIKDEITLKRADNARATSLPFAGDCCATSLSFADNARATSLPFAGDSCVKQPPFAGNTYVTLLPFAGNALGVTTRGLYYPLNDATLEVGSSWGVSNRLTEDTAHIKLKQGYLLVIISNEDAK